jgi:hypothetical protein
MLEKFRRFCRSVESNILNEESNDSAFENADDMLAALEEKLSLDLFKKDKTLIEKIKSTPKDIRESALDRFYDLSLKNEDQDAVIKQIYHYIKEF